MIEYFNVQANILAFYGLLERERERERERENEGERERGGRERGGRGGGVSWWVHFH